MDTMKFEYTQYCKKHEWKTVYIKQKREDTMFEILYLFILL